MTFWVYGKVAKSLGALSEEVSHAALYETYLDPTEI